MPTKLARGIALSAVILCAGLSLEVGALRGAEKRGLEKDAATKAAETVKAARASGSHIEFVKALDAANVAFARLEGASLFLTRGHESAKPSGGETGRGFWFDLRPDPRSPLRISDRLPPAWDVAVLGKHAIVCDYTRTLAVYEMGERAWQRVAELKMPSMTENICIRGNLAFIANHTAGLTIVDIAKPRSPAIVANFNPHIDCDALGFWKNCAILYGHWESRLVLVDVSEPVKPRQTSVFQYAGKFNQGELTVEGGLAYCTSVDGLVVVNVRDTANPKLVSVVKEMGATRDVAVHDGYAFVSAAKGIFVLDVGNPASPVTAGSYSQAGCHELAVVRLRSPADPKAENRRLHRGPGSDYLIYATGAKPSVLVFHAPVRAKTTPAN
jgi:hypothetical protein